jgi:class 3 adenylate cyclase
VTFLFTDIEGSTGLWEAAPAAMRAALARHDEILCSSIEAKGGYVFATGGDGFAAAFGRAVDGLAAAGDAQAALAAEAWPEGATLRVRIGLHTGEINERDGGLLRSGGEPGGADHGRWPRRAGRPVRDDRRAGRHFRAE